MKIMMDTDIVGKSAGLLRSSQKRSTCSVIARNEAIQKRNFPIKLTIPFEIITDYFVVFCSLLLIFAS
jgi:ABC-type polysaccharide/polyol phosphate export permease